MSKEIQIVIAQVPGSREQAALEYAQLDPVVDKRNTWNEASWREYDDFLAGAVLMACGHCDKREWLSTVNGPLVTQFTCECASEDTP